MPVQTGLRQGTLQLQQHNLDDLLMGPPREGAQLPQNAVALDDLLAGPPNARARGPGGANLDIWNGNQVTRTPYSGAAPSGGNFGPYSTPLDMPFMPQGSSSTGPLVTQGSAGAGGNSQIDMLNQISDQIQNRTPGGTLNPNWSTILAGAQNNIGPMLADRLGQSVHGLERTRQLGGMDASGRFNQGEMANRAMETDSRYSQGGQLSNFWLQHMAAGAAAGIPPDVSMQQLKDAGVPPPGFMQPNRGTGNQITNNTPLGNMLQTTAGPGQPDQAAVRGNPDPNAAPQQNQTEATPRPTSPMAGTIQNRLNAALRDFPQVGNNPQNRQIPSYTGESVPLINNAISNYFAQFSPEELRSNYTDISTAAQSKFGQGAMQGWYTTTIPQLQMRRTPQLDTHAAQRSRVAEILGHPVNATNIFGGNIVGQSLGRMTNPSGPGISFMDAAKQMFGIR